MSGIVGAYGKHPLIPDRSLALVLHRGPDGHRITRHPNGYLGHTRLAVTDAEAGQQPLSNTAGTRWLVCNGEIYNYPQLRTECPNYSFRTDSDSEIILALYEQDGPKVVKRLDGMFSFALIDEDGLFLARDPLGIKPLYFGWRDETLYFASEIKALQGMVDHVLEFPPGYYYSTGTGLEPYYDLISMAYRSTSKANDTLPVPNTIRKTLQTVVREQLMSDVPLGVFLSGGLDSSIIAALVSQDLNGVHSFAVGMEGSADLCYARKVANLLGTRHHEYVYTLAEMIEVLPSVIYYLESFDPALVRSAVANFLLARLAADYVTVVLSGEGADELYAGYSYLKQFSTADALRQELINITGELHSHSLQRLDRMTMAHGIEGRVPFLDTKFVQLAFSVPIEQKVYGPDAIEKWILRKAFEPMLPADVVWRVQRRFAEGAGSAGVLASLAEAQIDDDTYAREIQRAFNDTHHTIRSKEELYYYRIFRNYYQASITSLVAFSHSL